MNKLSFKEYINIHSNINCGNSFRLTHIGNDVLCDLYGIEKYKDIEKIYFFNNEIKDFEPLYELPLLEELSLTNDNYNLIDFSKLKIKKISLIGLKKIDFKFLENIQSLKSLTINNSCLIDITFLKKLTNLEELNLQSNSISDLRPIKNLKKLVELNLSCNLISDLKPIENLIKIEKGEANCLRGKSLLLMVLIQTESKF